MSHQKAIICRQLFASQVVDINAYADDRQLYGPVWRGQRSRGPVCKSGPRIKNELMANPSKGQLLVLGRTEQDFTFNIDEQQIKKCDDVDL